MYGVRKLVLHKGQPVRVEGQLLYEHKYSDHLIKLLEAGDPDHFNRQRVMPLDEGKLDNLTEGYGRSWRGCASTSRWPRAYTGGGSQRWPKQAPASFPQCSAATAGRTSERRSGSGRAQCRALARA
jgi:hypothetical protein